MLQPSLEHLPLQGSSLQGPLLLLGEGSTIELEFLVRLSVRLAGKNSLALLRPVKSLTSTAGVPFSPMEGPEETLCCTLSFLLGAFPHAVLLLLLVLVVQLAEHLVSQDCKFP